MAMSPGHLGPGIAFTDVAALCVAYGALTVAAAVFPWRRLDPRWMLVPIAVPVVFAGSLAAISGAGASPFSVIYMPVLAMAGWYLPARQLAATLVLVIVTEVWRALDLDQSRSIEYLAVALPFYAAIGTLAAQASHGLRTALAHTRRDQVRTAATLDAVRTLGTEPGRAVLDQLEEAMARTFDGEATVVRLEVDRPDQILPATSALRPNSATIVVPGAHRLHALVHLRSNGPLSAHDLRLAAMLADAAGRTMDVREALSETRAETERDALTGLLNRRAMDRDLAALFDPVRPAPRVVLMFIDLDHFKMLNDEFGHVAGDAVLVRIAGMLRATSRTADRVYRYGGDEFAVLIHDADLDEARRIADRVLARVGGSGRRSSDSGAPRVNLSVGIALCQPFWGPDDLIAAADAAMYAAKVRGGGVVSTADDADSAWPAAELLPPLGGDAVR
jgi:diguanylate cyclase (GGDEF)-like protein